MTALRNLALCVSFLLLLGAAAPMPAATELELLRARYAKDPRSLCAWTKPGACRIGTDPGDQILLRLGAASDPQLTAYAHKLASRLLRPLPVRGHYEILVLPCGLPSARTIGDTVVVCAELLTASQGSETEDPLRPANEDVVAFVLAHELSHLVLGHGEIDWGRGSLSSGLGLVELLGGFAVGSALDMADAVVLDEKTSSRNRTERAAKGTFKVSPATALLEAASRGNESAADRLATDMVVEAGYSARAATMGLEVLFGDLSDTSVRPRELLSASERVSARDRNVAVRAYIAAHHEAKRFKPVFNSWDLSDAAKLARQAQTTVNVVTDKGQNRFAYFYCGDGSGGWLLNQDQKVSYQRRNPCSSVIGDYYDEAMILRDVLARRPSAGAAALPPARALGTTGYAVSTVQRGRSCYIVVRRNGGLPVEEARDVAADILSDPAASARINEATSYLASEIQRFASCYNVEVLGYGRAGLVALQAARHIYFRGEIDLMVFAFETPLDLEAHKFGYLPFAVSIQRGSPYLDVQRMAVGMPRSPARLWIYPYSSALGMDGLLQDYMRQANVRPRVQPR